MPPPPCPHPPTSKAALDTQPTPATSSITGPTGGTGPSRPSWKVPSHKGFSTLDAFLGCNQPEAPVLH
ncbi:hypothetical protein H2248_011298 [Termitomyces sp. 'cryptogamus']|nr:hypothetical protein H2248_011298 [Termitomyces sp. 'cryptogamus']